jgi:hypothetical protein
MTPTLWVLQHHESGPIETFLTPKEANDALHTLMRAEPDWAPLLWVEPFQFLVADPSPN